MHNISVVVNGCVVLGSCKLGLVEQLRRKTSRRFTGIVSRYHAFAMFSKNARPWVSVTGSIIGLHGERSDESFPLSGGAPDIAICVANPNDNRPQNMRGEKWSIGVPILVIVLLQRVDKLSMVPGNRAPGYFLRSLRECFPELTPFETLLASETAAWIRRSGLGPRTLFWWELVTVPSGLNTLSSKPNLGW